MTDASAAGGAQLPPELAERVARRRAAMAEPGPASSAATAAPAGAAPAVAASTMQGAAPAATAPTRRPTRQPAGKGSRLAMAGGAIGLGFGLVGVMAAAASSDAGSPAAVVQRVVVPQAPVAAQPAQVIVMLPSNVDPSAGGSPITMIEVPAVDARVSIPDIPAAPAPAVMASAPVAESHGS